MNYRSTNQGFHSPKDIVSNIGSSHGVQLAGGSSGGTVQAVGDDTDITLNLLGKGAGGVRLGSTAAGSVGFKGAFSTTSTYSHAAISSGQTIELTAIASTTADVQPGDILQVDVLTPTTNTVWMTRQSTADASRVTVILGNISSTATSTGSGTLRITWLDLT